MRAHRLVPLCSLLLAAACAKKPKPVEATPVAAEAPAGPVFYKSTDGLVVAVLGQDSDQKVYVGDEKVLHEQRQIGYGSADGKWESYFWAPRAEGARAFLAFDGKELAATCKQDRAFTLTPYPAAEQERLRADTKLEAPLWDRQAVLLARTDDGVYYYVDGLRESNGKTGQRVFIGKPGAMAEQAMTNVIDDDKGQIFETKGGNLRLVFGSNEEVRWEKGKKKVKLLRLDPGENIYVIYRKFEIYKALGTLCDND